MNDPKRTRFPSIEPLMNALTVGGVAIAFAVIVAVSGIPGLTT